MVARSPTVTVWALLNPTRNERRRSIHSRPRAPTPSEASASHVTPRPYTSNRGAVDSTCHGSAESGGPTSTDALPPDTVVANQDRSQLPGPTTAGIVNEGYSNLGTVAHTRSRRLA